LNERWLQCFSCALRAFLVAALRWNFGIALTLDFSRRRPAVHPFEMLLKSQRTAGSGRVAVHELASMRCGISCVKCGRDDQP
jgi:hypothetical protein